MKPPKPDAELVARKEKTVMQRQIDNEIRLKRLEAIERNGRA